MRSRYDKNVPNPSHHQCGERIINHRLVVDRQQLFRHNQGYRVKSRAGSASENYPLHEVSPRELNRTETTSRVRWRQSAARNPKIVAKRDESSSELIGRFAGVGYSAVVIAVTFGRRVVNFA